MGIQRYRAMKNEPLPAVRLCHLLLPSKRLQQRKSGNQQIYAHMNDNAELHICDHRTY